MLFQFICSVPKSVTFVHAFHFINLTWLVGTYYEKVNGLLQQSGGRMDMRTIDNLCAELNYITRLLSKFYGSFLLASIGANFMMTVNLNFELFLYFHGVIDLSILSILSISMWLCLPFVFVMSYM